MKKVRSDARWNKLSVKQRETLDKWFFEEGLSYDAILPRARSELGFKGSKASLQRYYVRRDGERTATRFLDARQAVAAVNGAPVDANELRRAGWKLLGEFLFQQIRQCPEKVKEWGMVASLIVDNDRNELLRELKGEELKVRQEAMAFAREKFQFDMVKRALKALPELQELAEAKKDPDTEAYEEKIRTNRIILAMFDRVREVFPESDQEAKEMLAAKREREARRVAQQEATAERRRVWDELGGAQPPTPSSQYYEEYVADQAKEEAEAEEREKAWRASQAEVQAQAAVIAEAKQTEAAKRAEEAKQAEREKRRKYREARAKFEEMRELCGWQELSRPPGWKEMDGWKDAPLEWDLQPND